MVLPSEPSAHLGGDGPSKAPAERSPAFSMQHDLSRGSSCALVVVLTPLLEEVLTKLVLTPLLEEVLAKLF